MNFITRWCTEIQHLFSNCFNHETNSQLSDYYYLNIRDLAKHCLHISNKKDFICYKCFLKFFHYDRFIIRQIFFYLNPLQTDYIHIKEFSLFAERIINWHEFINHIDFIIQLFQILLSTNDLVKKTNQEYNFLKINRDLNESQNLEYSFTNLLKQYESLEHTTINSILLYELIKDAFFFTAIQANVQTTLTNESQVRCFI